MNFLIFVFHWSLQFSSYAVFLNAYVVSSNSCQMRSSLSSSLPHSLITISMSFHFPSHLHDNSTRKICFYEGGIQRAERWRGMLYPKS